MNTLAFIGLKHIKDVILDKQIETVYMENHEEIISRLKFIGHIQKEEKINVRHVNKQPNTLLTKLYRSLIYPDNRWNSLKFIKDVVIRSYEIVQYNIHRGDMENSKSILSDLIRAKQGIANLKYTYNDDTKFCCDMDVIIETIDTQMNSLKRIYPDLFYGVEKEEVTEDNKSN
jgi:hypothetical protein